MPRWASAKALGDYIGVFSRFIPGAYGVPVIFLRHFIPLEIDATFGVEFGREKLHTRCKAVALHVAYRFAYLCALESQELHRKLRAIALKFRFVVESCGLHPLGLRNMQLF